MPIPILDGRLWRLLAIVAIAALHLACAAAGKSDAGALRKEPKMITVHYHRYDGDYEGLGLWTWDKDHGPQPAQQELFPIMEDEFGKVFRIDPSLYGHPGKAGEIGFIFRLRGDWQHKDGGDRFWRPELGDEIWAIGNEPELYTEQPDIAPKVQAAFIDDLDKITIKLSHGMELGRLVPKSFRVVSAAGPHYEVLGVRAAEIRDQKARLVELTVKGPVDYKHPIAVHADGCREGEAQLRKLLLQPDFAVDGQLGAIYSKDKTTFRVFAPTADKAEVVIYDEPTGAKGRRAIAMKPDARGLAWEAVVDGDLSGKHYVFKVAADGPEANREVVDIYSRMNTGHDGRGRIGDVRALDPAGFRETKRPANIESWNDAVIWEVSVRDFTMDPNSGVPAKLRGKFLGAALRGTTIPGTEIKTGIDHLKELGVTHVQILPIQDFDNREDAPGYNWGYMTASFDSPDGWFASNHRDESRVREFKAMIQAFHDAGIRVIMDVVYNHTAPTATFESLVPGYYHRRREDGSMWNGSGTGNEFHSEAPMARKFVLDSCKYWLDEYKVDGFRFDLMGLLDMETMGALRDEMLKLDPTLMLYGEPWAATGPDGTGIARITYKDVTAGTGVGAFNDNFRNALKGAPDGPEPGFVQDGRNREGVMKGIAGGITDWTKGPRDPIQYATCHDNLSLWDKVKLSAPNETPEEHIKMQMLTVGVLSVSQGIMFLHAGTEIGYDKQGAHNSYDAPDSINMIRWDKKQKHANLFEFSKGTIAMRRAHPVFRLRTAEEIAKRLHFHADRAPSDKCIVFTLDGDGVPGEAWKKVLVLINGDARNHVFPLPAGEWTAYMHGEKAGIEPIAKVRDNALLAGRTMTVLVAE